MTNTNNTTEVEASAKPMALHPVYTVTNIQHKVRVLDGKDVSYSSWVKLFKLHARRYEVLSHIDGTPPPEKDDPSFSSWQKIDSIMLQWIYGTLSSDLLDRILEAESTDLEAWNRLKRIFHNNKGPSVAVLETQFVNLKLRDMSSLEAYCQRLKELGSQLADLDAPMNEERLVLQLVRGLPPEFNVTGALIHQSIPSWVDACNMLQSDRDRQKACEIPAPMVAAAVHENHSNRRPSNNRSDSSRSSPRSQHRRHSQNTLNHSALTWKNCGHGWDSHRNASGPSRFNHQNWQPPFGPQPTWPNYWNHPPPPPSPYPTQTGWAAPPWAAPPGYGQLTTGPGPKQQPTPNTSSPSAQAHLAEYDALNPIDLSNASAAMHTNEKDGPWHMDTGATSHITSDQGFHGWENPNET